MTQPPQPRSPTTRRRWIGLLLLVPMLLFTGVVLLAVGVGSCLFLGSETRGLRDTMRRAAAVGCVKQVEINVRPAVLSLARPALSFLDLDPVARRALSALRSAEVGVYKLACAPETIDRASALALMDASMTRRGWTRVVGVLEPTSLVAVYAPQNVRSPSNMRFSLVVLEKRQMVVVSARTDLEPLADIALAKANLSKNLAMAFSR